jgi:hypothetical protein
MAFARAVDSMGAFREQGSPEVESACLEIQSPSPIHWAYQGKGRIASNIPKRANKSAFENGSWKLFPHG